MLSTGSVSLPESGANGAAPEAEAGRWPGTGGYRADLVLLADPFQHWEVFDFCRRWMERRQRPNWAAPGRLSFTRPESGGPGRLRVRSDRGEYVEQVTVDLRLESIGDDLRVAATVQRRIQSAVCANDRRGILPPKLVPALVREFGAFRDSDVLLRPRLCDRSDAVRLVEYVVDPKRTVPALVISPVPKGAPLVNGNTIARIVAGMAHVYLLADDHAVNAFCQGLQSLGCSGGAMRLYRVEAAATEKPPTHPQWVPNYLVGPDGEFLTLRIAEDHGGAGKQMSGARKARPTSAHGRHGPVDRSDIT